MSASLVTALFFTIALLVVSAYTLMGSAPLLILKHDTPMDARFVRGFFNTCYSAAAFIGGATAVSYAFAGRPGFAAGAAVLASLAAVLRRTLIPKMDSLRALIERNETRAVRGFRRLQMAAMLFNLAQVVLIVWGVVTLSMQMR